MKFGQVDDPGKINFALPEDDPRTVKILKAAQKKPLKAFVGCAKWNRKDLKGFYPRGTKDELRYYASQFNSIELNATFYNMPGVEQVKTWKEKTPEGFRFFPKIPQRISHFGRLSQVDEQLRDFVTSAGGFADRLGMTFLQMHPTFKPDMMARVEEFLHKMPASVPLAVEVRHPDWFKPSHLEELFRILEQEDKTAVIVDTAGRRDMLHMRLSTPFAFIRYVGANHKSDYTRLDDWIPRLERWKEQGLQELYFFIHQNEEKESPKLAAYFIKKLNKHLGLDLKVPELPSGS